MRPQEEKTASVTAHVTGEVSENGSSPAPSQPPSEGAIPAGGEFDPMDNEVCPYPGLAPFRESEAQWFFGREETIKDVISRLGERLDGGEPLLVMAPSGAGKSSLLAAGVIPALKGGVAALPGSRDWPVVDMTPGKHPLTSLATRVAEKLGAEESTVAEATTDPKRFTAFLAAVSTRIVLIVDQFEEVFIDCRQDSKKKEFIAALCAAAHSGTGLVVLGVRADFEGSCRKYPELEASLDSPLELRPMSDDEFRDVILGPAEREHLHIESGLVELLLSDLAVVYDPSVTANDYDRGALPLLAHALRATWEKCNGRELTVDGYQRTGGIRKAISTTAESAYAQLSPAEQRIAEQLLLRMVNVSEHSRALRLRVLRERLVQALPSPAEASENKKINEKILEVFGRASLITLDATSVAITHEALLWAWPRLAGWINADHSWLCARQRITEAAEEWESKDHDPSLLYRGYRVDMAQDWVADPRHNERLNDLEVAFLHASIDDAQREQQTQQRRTRNLRILAGVLAVAFVMALLGVGVAVMYYKQARKTKEDAIAGEIAADSYAGAAAHPEVAMLRAVEAFGRTQNPKTLSALLSAQSLYFAGQFSGHEDSINTAAFSPDGRRLVTTSDDGTVRLWSTVDHHLINTPVSSPDNPAYDAKFSPDGAILATIRKNGSVQLWNSASLQLIGTIDTLSDAPGITFREATSVAFDRDGLILATVSGNKAQLWNVASLRRIAGLPGDVRKIVFNPVNRTAAIISSDVSGQLMSLADPANPTRLCQLPVPSFISAAVFSPDGNTLVTANSDRTASVWDVRDPRAPNLLGKPLVGHTRSIESMAFSPEGSTLVTGSEDGTARLWDVATQKTLAIFGGPNGPAINDVSFNQDGHTVVTAHVDGIARLWDKRGPILISSPPVESDSKVKFGPGGKRLVVYGPGGLWLWDAVERSQIAAFGGPVSDLAFGPNSLILAIARESSPVILWDTIRQSQIVALPVRTGKLGKVASSPDGKILAIADDTGKSLQLWSLEDPNRPVMLTRPLRLPGTSLFNKMTFDLNGEVLAVATFDGDISLLDVRKPYNPAYFGQALKAGRTLSKIDDNFIAKMSFSRDGRTLVVARGQKGVVERWDVRTGGLLSELTIPSDFPGVYVYSVGLSPDGSKLASADGDNAKIKLWDLGGEWAQDKRAPMVTLTGHTDGVSDTDFSRDGDFLATVSGDGTVRIWDLDPARVAGRLCHIIGPVSDKDRTMLVSAEISSKPACQR